VIGETLSHYRIDSKLGEGGMGEVYCAHDERLDRDVAIKVLPEEVAQDEARLARFEREAKLLASLSHQNIATLYGLEEHEGQRFLVMELAEGETLAERIKKGAIPVDDALPIALQIAEGLEAAHEQGIIHRDLKPANVMLSPEGKVKVLDFGLAKAWAPDEGDAELTHSPTLTAQMTAAGVLLGTAAYMSPEQARGKPVDKRADIWAFGCVLYEMLTGRRAFDGDTVTDVLAAVVRTEPDWSLLPGLPVRVRRTLERCLVREPKDRLRDIGEARIALGTTTTEEPEEAAPDSGRRRRVRRSLFITGGIVLAATLVAGLIGWSLKPTPYQPVRRFELLVDDLQVDFVRSVLISPDGSKILIPSQGRLWIRDLMVLDSREVPGSSNSEFCCWSPDGSHVAFLAGGRVWKAPSDGGSSSPVATVPADVGGSGGLAWTATGQILVTGGAETGILQVSDQGGEFREILPLDEHDRDFHELGLLPDGESIVFVVHRLDPASKHRIVDSLAVYSSGRRKEVLRLDGAAIQSVAYSRSGHLLFHRSDTTPGVWAVPFSPGRLAVTGEPFLVVADFVRPSVAMDGTLVFVRGQLSPLRKIVEVDRTGQIIRAFGHIQEEATADQLSPDGKLLAVTALDNTNWDVWIYDVEREVKVRFTFDSTADVFARWSPSGDKLLYRIADESEVRLARVDGKGEPRTVASTGGRSGSAPSWSADGSSFVFQRDPGETGSSDIWLRELEAEGASPLLASQADETAPAVSPDGRFLAYSSNESGVFEVFICRFPVVDRKWQVSEGGGDFPSWSPDGRELFFLTGDTLMAVEILDTDPLVLGRPSSLFSLGAAGLSLGSPPMSAVAVGPGGQSFFIGRTVDSAGERRSITVVQNWFEEFRER
jgi:serine/threonine protein kinase/dipeptidyl aminopeptidase/acylaminoacyl peptidase